MRKTFEKLIIASSEYSTILKLWQDYTEQANFIDNRKRENIIIKHAFAVASRELTNLSLNDIGSILNKDHATVLHAEKKHEENMMYLNGYKATYNLFVKELKKVLDIEIIKSEAEDIEAQELRNRLIDTSSRLRLQIIENKKLKEKLETSSPKLQEENKVLSKILKDMQQRNEKLNAELIRVKNLL